MKTFGYECLNKQGETVKGQMNADDLPSASARLRSMGLYILSLGENRTSSSRGFFKLTKGIPIGELSLFSRQLSTMLRVGIPVTRALFVLSSQQKNSSFKKVLEDVARDVEGGMNLTDAFSAHPKTFSSLYVSMIHSGELGGMMDDTLLRLSDQLQRDKSLRDSIKSATVYPRVILVFASILIISMLMFLTPVFRKMIPDTVQLPFITRVMFGFSDSLRNYWPLWILCLSAVIFGIAYYLKRPASKRLWDKMKFRLPVFGPLIQKSVIARFSRTLVTLLEGGIPVVQALQSAGPTAGSILVADAVTAACKGIEEGKNISGPLEESGVFTPMVIQMISVGEETGSLPLLLERIAQFYEEEVATISKGLAALVEPVMMIAVGIVVGIMLISLYLPIFISVTSVGG